MYPSAVRQVRSHQIHNSLRGSKLPAGLVMQGPASVRLRVSWLASGTDTSLKRTPVAFVENADNAGIAELPVAETIHKELDGNVIAVLAVGRTDECIVGFSAGDMVCTGVEKCHKEEKDKPASSHATVSIGMYNGWQQ